MSESKYDIKTAAERLATANFIGSGETRRQVDLLANEITEIMIKALMMGFTSAHVIIDPSRRKYLPQAEEVLAKTGLHIEYAGATVYLEYREPKGTKEGK